MAKTSKGCIVWQWNCRSLAPKRGHLHQYLQSLPPERKPDVLAIQETWKAITIPGYQAFNHTNSSGVVRVTTLVRRNLPAQLHSTGIENIEHTFIEILAGKKKSHRSTFILNVYSPPKARHSFHQLLRAAIDMAKGKALLIVGDFNAPHMSWGYPRDSAKGRQLWQDIATLGLDLLTDPTQPTRKATGGYKDTSPDLTLGHCLDAEWHNTLETLGSDHYILNILLRRGPTKPMGRPLRVVEWDTFRQELDEVDRDGEIKDLDQWTAGIREVEASATRNIPEEANLTAADSRLLHLWEMKTNLEARLRRKKGNRRLRKRIATLYKTIESHATYLTTKQWEDTCNEFEGAPNTPKTWNILRHLLDPGQSRTTVRNQMECILNSFKGDGNELVQEVQNKYIGRAPPTPAMEYTDVIRLIKAFVISRIAYIAPFLDLTLTERDAIDRIIRCVYKKALHLTPSTETKRLEKLGLHNTLSEIIEAQRIAHYERLSLTTEGRTILTSLGINYHPTGHSTRGWLPNELREQLKISPLPRHMYPVHDAGRRMARVKALENTLQQGYDDSEVTYVDAASADRGRMTLAVTNRSGQILTAGSMYTSNSAEAEEAAIALALTLSTTKVIVSDSQMAIRQYMRGHISDKALKIATGHRLIDHPVRILWSPAHASLPGNESAHSAACALTNRASTPSEHSTSATWNHDNLYTFKGVLDHYRVERRAYPEAHSTLNKAESTILRQVQTETFLNPAQLHSWYPDTYDPSCRNCGEIATLHHILWGCPELLLHSKNKEFIKQARQPGAWESFLRDPDPTTQKILVQLASDAAGNIAFRLSTEWIASSRVSP
ncbi:uncharacterized protein LOC121838145 [Ixodes scapularis]|uniref:uncharacterized protein LOC121838145 n=1 Tax=Ixodes scapularis TaxID=6945 RepID=UPI001C3896CF|nr:uncharacterized protein LOC121838145 [Ixodes scapularis]